MHYMYFIYGSLVGQWSRLLFEYSDESVFDNVSIFCIMNRVCHSILHLYDNFEAYIILISIYCYCISAFLLYILRSHFL